MIQGHLNQHPISTTLTDATHLGLQVSLLSEQEMTKLIQMLEGITIHLGIQQQIMDAEAHEPGQNTAVGDLARQLREQAAVWRCLRRGRCPSPAGAKAPDPVP